MATMGGGKVSGKIRKAPEAAKQLPLAAPLAHGLNVVIPIARLAPVMKRGGDLPVVGLPIMREGFVTETGFLPPSIDG